jgi:threonyl-tRNA synthetase
MKLLLIHSDFVEWEPKTKALKSAEEAEKKKCRANEALVVFTAVEKGDEKDYKKAAENALKEIKDVFKQVKAKIIVLYPYAHLSSDLASPSAGLETMKSMEAELRKANIPVRRAPFGWYKSFDIKCKGHPLSELSKSISVGDEGTPKGKQEVSEAVKKEEKLTSTWYVIEPSGKLHKVEFRDGKVSGFDFSRHPKLLKLANHEMAKSREVKGEPPHIKLMQKLGLVGYEPGSDPGNFRYLPKGRMVKALLEEWVTKKVLEYGAMEVETPIMYDYEHPCLKSYLNRFPARQYTIETPNKRVFLRFSACFGQFLIMRDGSVSYRNLPLKMYELTHYSFRVEQRGELAGLRRLRTFVMPDCHAFCKDLKQAKEEMTKRFDVANEVQTGTGLDMKTDMEFSMRAVKDFFTQNKDYVLKLVKRWGKPVLLEVWDQRFFYFIYKLEWNFIDALGKAACLATDQIDVENAERYGIRFTDKDNKQKYPLILHQSPSGSIERVMYALLEKAYMEQKAGKNPLLPLWLSPTQVRICPINDSFNRYCGRIADKLQKQNIRVDIDDRIESVGKKIRDGELEWVPAIVVIGPKEKKSGKLAVRFRATGNVRDMTPGQLARHIKKETEGKPFRPIPLPRNMTERAVFV